MISNMSDSDMSDDEAVLPREDELRAVRGIFDSKGNDDLVFAFLQHMAAGLGNAEFHAALLRLIEGHSFQRRREWHICYHDMLAIMPY